MKIELTDEKMGTDIDYDEGMGRKKREMKGRVMPHKMDTRHLKFE